MKKTLITLLFLSSIHLFAKEKDPLELGNVTKEELLIREYSVVASASAYYFFDKGSCELNYSGRDWEVEMTRELKLKILKPEASDAGTFLIDLWHEDNIAAIKAYTYNLEDGEIVKVKLSKDNIHEEKISDELTEVTINMPQVKAGSIIELTYRITTYNIDYLQPWDFQGRFPRSLSMYTVYEPKEFEYKKLHRGLVQVQELPVEKTSRGAGQYTLQCNRHIYYAQDVPAFEKEPHINSAKNYRSSIEFNLTRSISNRVRNFGSNWLEIDKSFQKEKRFGAKQSSNRAIDQLLISLGLESHTHYDLMHEIYDVMKANLRWDGRHRALAATDHILEVWENKEGSSADLNLLLIALLQQAGLAAEPVLISTREHGEIMGALPSHYFFNHVIAQVTLDSIPHFLDLSGHGVGAGQLPFKDLNNIGRLPFSHEWVALTPSGSHLIQSLYNLKLDPENAKVSGQLQLKLKDYAAIDFLTESKNLDKEQILQQMREEHSQLEINNLEHTPLRSGQEIKLELALSSGQHIELAGKRLFVQPLIFSDESNPFTAELRRYPVDLGHPLVRQHMATLEIPAGYQVSSLPEASRIILMENAGEFLYQAVQVGNMIQINCILKLNRTLYQPEVYDQLREFFALSYSKQEEMIVLEKS